MNNDNSISTVEQAQEMGLLPEEFEKISSEEPRGFKESWRGCVVSSRGWRTAIA